MSKCHFPEPFPPLDPKKRDREFKKYSSGTLRGEVAYKWMVEGWSTRAIDVEVLNFYSYYPNSQADGFQSMGMLHYLGLNRNHQGYFKDMALKDIVSTINILRYTIEGFDKVYGVMMSYILAIHEQEQQQGQDWITHQWLEGCDEGEITRKLEDARLETSREIIISGTFRYYSSAALKASLKDLYDYKCQVCGTVIYKKGWSREMPRREQWNYLNADVHHILPLSRQGKDRRSNMLCLCPNCHRKFHTEEYTLTQRHTQIICYDQFQDKTSPLTQMHKIELP